VTTRKWVGAMQGAWGAPGAEIRCSDGAARVDLRAEEGRTVLELETVERPGLLASVSEALVDTEFRITRCEVHTRGNHAVHRFHLVDPAGKAPGQEWTRALRQLVFKVLDTEQDPVARMAMMSTHRDALFETDEPTPASQG
jgi:hypothetical protein